MPAQAQVSTGNLLEVRFAHVQLVSTQTSSRLGPKTNNKNLPKMSGKKGFEWREQLQPIENH